MHLDVLTSYRKEKEKASTDRGSDPRHLVSGGPCTFPIERTACGEVGFGGYDNGMRTTIDKAGRVVIPAGSAIASASPRDQR